ncbi:hypothetical protein G4G28_00980 [Massilia sp. Dwa41.01b]|uniref:hypothetical protein n=1 Tax=unclassified Massilia TaxID=2609279 RepID=UPI001600399F|nr:MULTISPECIES: hypothetical protein [unclassified Massilia]QNA87401.1 hypothetical protein G4G28_00980 [Massilia sp. Dwa41.01b]QNA98307.1 hypothetical protein G4G31_04740 [Massilia sp. Se16.2.3]
MDESQAGSALVDAAYRLGYLRGRIRRLPEGPSKGMYIEFYLDQRRAQREVGPMSMGAVGEAFARGVADGERSLPDQPDPSIPSTAQKR